MKFNKLLTIREKHFTQEGPTVQISAEVLFIEVAFKGDASEPDLGQFQQQLTELVHRVLSILIANRVAIIHESVADFGPILINFGRFR